MSKLRFHPVAPGTASGLSAGATSPDGAAFRAWHDTTARFVPSRSELEAMVTSPAAARPAREAAG